MASFISVAGGSRKYDRDALKLTAHLAQTLELPDYSIRPNATFSIREIST